MWKVQNNGGVGECLGLQGWVLGNTIAPREWMIRELFVPLLNKFKICFNTKLAFNSALPGALEQRPWFEHGHTPNPFD